MKPLLVAPIVTLALSVAASAQHGLLGIDYTAFGLWDVDTDTGTCSNRRNVTASFVVGIAAAPDGTLYGLTTLGSIPFCSLITIDPATGATTTVGSTGLIRIYEGDLAFDPTTGVLYGIQDYTGYKSWLFTLDRATGVATPIAPVGTTGLDLSAMAFDSSGNCYMIETNGSFIYQVDKTDGNVIAMAALSGQLGEVAGMAFDPITDTLYVADGYLGGTDHLFTCNTVTGLLTVVGYTGLGTGLCGLTFRCTTQASATFRNDSGGTNPTGYVASPPVMDTLWTASVDNAGMNNTLAGVVGYLTPLEYYLPGPDDWLLVNIVDPNGELLGIGTRAGSGVVSFSAPVPGDAALCGFAASTQGFGLGGTGGINLHNAYDVVLGTN